MKELVPVLEKLAEKLGVTSGYLWDVLVKQAFIDGILSIMFAVLTSICVAVLYKLHKKFSGKHPNSACCNWYEKLEYLGPAMFLPTTFIGVMVVVAIIGLFGAVTAFVNPEYWALHEILSVLKSK